MFSFPFELEKTIFRATCGFAVLYEIYAVGIDLLLEIGFLTSLLDSVLLCFFTFFSILSFKLKDPIKTLQWPFVIILFAGISFFWFEDGGISHGSIGYISTAVLIAVILVATPPQNYFFGLAFFSLQCFLSVLEIYFPFLFSTSKQEAWLELHSTFLVINLFIGIMISFLKYLFDQERNRMRDTSKLLEEHSKMIQNQNEQLREKSDEILAINLQLEKRVKERTKEIRQQKRKIEDYTYLNAHKLRGAISRILGLSSLNRDTESQSESEKLLGMIDQSAKEADEVLKEITQKLSKGEKN